MQFDNINHQTDKMDLRSRDFNIHRKVKKKKETYPYTWHLTPLQL